ncbi:formate/nitrite transporter family protein [Novosphingobium sp. 9]|uniref:formate/nitrite transporter family protein n=1 Tax=Novosphingobium sp. 9 TaxID=2025349 RepID=UPI0021B67100|nr:formate/nitrite transporter family protein [Novosphingobium sp. 9]
MTDETPAPPKPSTRATSAERENEAREIASGDTSLTRHERSQVDENKAFSALTMFTIIRRQGEEELRRPLLSLWWSGIAAGIGICASVFVQALLWIAFAHSPYRLEIAQLGYTVGFVIVILSRLQLFTENTLSVVLPALHKPTRERFVQWARLWAVVLVANLVGTFATALVVPALQIASPEQTAAMLEVSRHAMEASGWEAMMRGVPAGFFIAALVWMLPNAKGFELFLIMLMSWLIVAGGFTHIIAGSAEAFLLMLHGEVGVSAVFTQHLVPILAGNVLGGTGLFALLAYGQIHAEI